MKMLTTSLKHYPAVARTVMPSPPLPLAAREAAASVPHGAGLAPPVEGRLGVIPPLRQWPAHRHRLSRRSGEIFCASRSCLVIERRPPSQQPSVAPRMVCRTSSQRHTAVKVAGEMRKVRQISGTVRLWSPYIIDVIRTRGLQAVMADVYCDYPAHGPSESRPCLLLPQPPLKMR
jgi:hypothetical protein